MSISLSTKSLQVTNPAASPQAMSHPEKTPRGVETGLQFQTQVAEESAMSKSLAPGDGPVRNLNRVSWFCVVFSLLAALFLFALDNTIVANVQENIIYTLGGIEKLPWISVAFALGAVATNLFWYVLSQDLSN